jgi:predicted nucleic acid-binding protein
MTLYVTVSQTMDISYILARQLKDAVQARAIVKLVGDNLTLTDVTVADYRNAIISGISDFEDAVLAACAKRIKADYIVTRNVRDFAQSPVPAISPNDFLGSSPTL